MNKKRLSVVMAGAMLASSVAPVLAAETNNNTEVSAAQKGELVNELARKIWNQPIFSNVSDNRVDSNLKGKSVYAIQIDDTINYISENVAGNAEGSETKLKAHIKGLLENLKAGQTVKLVNLGYRELTEDGKKLILSTNESNTYSKAELTQDNEGSVKHTLDTLIAGNLTDEYANLITKYGYNEKEQRYEITLGTKAKEAYGKDMLILTTNTKRYDFSLAKIKDSNEVKKIEDGFDFDANKFAGFAEAVAHNDDIANVVEAEYKITSGGDTFNTRDLYDGLFLTTKGYELLNSAKEVKALLHSNGITTEDTNIVGTVGSISGSNGKYSITIKIANAEKVLDDIKTDRVWSKSANQYDAYHISGDSKTELQTLVDWLKGIDAKVDKVEGEDRYTTAVKLAKEVGLVGGIYKTKDIVLVNGNALVDGLAAAPLAGYLSTEHSAQAPILLTAKNELPNPTKRYLKELIDQEINKKITVHIVGGESVVSDNVKRQLRALGLNVERYAGEDRESTSMAVAKEIGFENGAFVVGARGEADAMSISGFAASRKAPVVVSGFGGLSEDTIDALDGVRVSVIGGESRISKSEYEEIKAVAESAKRVSGEDRKSTNAAVINTFYKDNFRGEAKAVIVAKDDVLVDALAAANLSSVENAPIVLGRKSLSKGQVASIVENANTADKVYQIGGGVAPSVVKVVAEALKLVNK